MIWLTGDGYPYTLLVLLYGRLVSSAGEEFKSACEARLILSKPREDRPAFIESISRKRSPKDEEGVRAIRDALTEAVMREWDWRKKQRESAP